MKKTIIVIVATLLLFTSIGFAKGRYKYRKEQHKIADRLGHKFGGHHHHHGGHHSRGCFIDSVME